MDITQTKERVNLPVNKSTLKKKKNVFKLIPNKIIYFD